MRYTAGKRPELGAVTKSATDGSDDGDVAALAESRRPLHPVKAYKPHISEETKQRAGCHNLNSSSQTEPVSTQSS